MHALTLLNSVVCYPLNCLHCRTRQSCYPHNGVTVIVPSSTGNLLFFFAFLWSLVPRFSLQAPPDLFCIYRFLLSSSFLCLPVEVHIRVVEKLVLGKEVGAVGAYLSQASGPHAAIVATFLRILSPPACCLANCRHMMPLL